MARSNRVLVYCKVCGKEKSINLYEFNKNTTGIFYCGRECMSIDRKSLLKGKGNPFYGKKHSDETKVKITGENHWNYGNKKPYDKTATCKFCGKVFQYRGPDRIFCCPKCKQDYNKSTRVVKQCGYCGKDVEVIACKKDQQNVFCDRECYRLYRKFILEYDQTGPKSYWYGKRGEETANWRGGLSYEPYDKRFDAILKEKIRSRDNHSCQLCGKPQDGVKLSIHHIDYNKKNNRGDNLISLCKACHSTTNGDREYWPTYFYVLLKRKGATTIPKGSRLQANGSRSAGHPLKRVMI